MSNKEISKIEERALELIAQLDQATRALEPIIGLECALNDTGWLAGINQFRGSYEIMRELSRISNHLREVI